MLLITCSLFTFRAKPSTTATCNPTSRTSNRMCPVLSRVGGICPSMLLSLLLCSHAIVAYCPPSCLCTSDIISCSGYNLTTLPFDLPRYATRLDLGHNRLAALHAHWIVGSFDRLTALILSQNHISRIELGAFVLMPNLRHLDLSCNRLSTLNASSFHGLEELEVLLLFGNQVSQVNREAFRGLHKLQRLYLSGNRLTDFPLELYNGLGAPKNLAFLDLSSNLVVQVPVQSLLSLPSQQQGGIYLQGNPLICDCPLVAMLEYWLWKQYASLLEFSSDYPCRLDGLGGGAVSNCSVSRQEPSGHFHGRDAYHIEPGGWLRVPCPGLAPDKRAEPAVFWITPGAVLNSSTHNPSAHLEVLPNGTLEIRGATVKDSGAYSCVAARGYSYDPDQAVEVSVLVGNASVAGVNGASRGGGAENFNTAFTTLASCVVSIILVLLYLYLTPCRCCDGKGGGERGCGGRAILLCSDPTEVNSGERRTSGKRVAFLEPQVEDCDKCVPKTQTVTLAHATTEGILKNGSRAAGPLTGHTRVVQM